MESRWGFLAPWCADLKDRLKLSSEEDPWGDQLPSLKLALNQHPVNAVPKMAEALLLVMAVHHVDKSAWKFLLGRYCNVGVTENVPPRVVVDMNLSTWGNEGDAATARKLMLLCGTNQREHPSAQYFQALAKIASMDPNLQTNKPGIDVQIPVRVYIEDTWLPENADGEMDRDSAESTAERIRQEAAADLLGTLKALQKANKTIRDQWQAHGSSLGVMPGSLRSTLVLEPTSATFSGHGMMRQIMEAMHSSVLDVVPFSQLKMAFGAYNYTQVNELAARKALAQLMAHIFVLLPRSHQYSARNQVGSTSSTQPLLEHVQLNCDLPDLGTARACDFEQLCSAMAFNQSVPKVSLLLNMLTYSSEFDSKTWWKWLAYGLFSKRARACSVLESLSLSSISSMSVADMQGFAAVVASDHPEEALFNCPRGQVNDRKAVLKAGSSIRWPFDGQGNLVRVHGVPATALTCPSQMENIHTFSDDGRSEWVNVLIPGFGRCQVQRSNLLFEGGSDTNANPAALLSLAISVKRTALGSPLDGFQRFLEAVGGSLRSLRVVGGSLTEVTRSCPNLEELTIQTAAVQAQFDFRSYREEHHATPVFRVNLNNIPVLAQALSSDNALTNSLCQLRLRLGSTAEPTNYYRRVQETSPDVTPDLIALAEMLKCNQTLEYLGVVAPKSDPRLDQLIHQHHLQPIRHPGDPLSMESKLSFLSVASAHHEAKKASKRKKVEAHDPKPPVECLNQRVLSTIFAFARSPRLRQVHLRVRGEGH